MPKADTEKGPQPADEAPAYAGLTVHERLRKVMERVSYIQKDKKQGMNYTIVSHDKVTALVRDHFVDWGLVMYPVNVVPEVVGNRTHATVTFRIASVDNVDSIDVMSFGHGVDAQDKGPGKAMSYAAKYAILKSLMLETGDDPDETQDSRADYKSPDVLRANAQGDLLFGELNRPDLTLEMLQTLLAMDGTKTTMSLLEKHAAGRYMAAKQLMSKKLKELKAQSSEGSDKE